MAKNIKSVTSKPAGKQAVPGGPSGKMKKFGGAPAQVPGQSAQLGMTGKGPEFPSGGGSGKMQKFSPSKPQKSSVTAQQSGGGRSSYAK